LVDECHRYWWIGTGFFTYPETDEIPLYRDGKYRDIVDAFGDAYEAAKALDTEDIAEVLAAFKTLQEAYEALQEAVIAFRADKAEDALIAAKADLGELVKDIKTYLGEEFFGEDKITLEGLYNYFFEVEGNDWKVAKAKAMMLKSALQGVKNATTAAQVEDATKKLQKAFDKLQGTVEDYREYLLDLEIGVVKGLLADAIAQVDEYWYGIEAFGYDYELLIRYAAVFYPGFAEELDEAYDYARFAHDTFKDEWSLFEVYFDFLDVVEDMTLVIFNYLDWFENSDSGNPELDFAKAELQGLVDSVNDYYDYLVNGLGWDKKALYDFIDDWDLTLLTDLCDAIDAAHSVLENAQDVSEVNEAYDALDAAFEDLKFVLLWYSPPGVCNCVDVVDVRVVGLVQRGNGQNGANARFAVTLDIDLELEDGRIIYDTVILSGIYYQNASNQKLSETVTLTVGCHEVSVTVVLTVSGSGHNAVFSVADEDVSFTSELLEVCCCGGTHSGNQELADAKARLQGLIGSVNGYYHEVNELGWDMEAVYDFLNEWDPTLLTDLCGALGAARSAIENAEDISEVEAAYEVLDAVFEDLKDALSLYPPPGGVIECDCTDVVAVSGSLTQERSNTGNGSGARFTVTVNVALTLEDDSVVYHTVSFGDDMYNGSPNLSKTDTLTVGCYDVAVTVRLSVTGNNQNAVFSVATPNGVTFTSEKLEVCCCGVE